MVTAHVAEVVENDQVELVELVDGALQRQCLAGGLEALDEVGGAGERHAIAVLDEGLAERGAEMRFA